MSRISAKITSNFLDMFNFRRMVEKSLQKPVRRNKPFDLSAYHKSFFVSEFQVMGKSVATLEPKGKITTNHILYFHGGAYLLEGGVMHWKIIETIATKANCKVSYIDYPLAPENTYIATFDMVQQSYNQLISIFPDDQFIFMGDSAGGGLALAFTQKLVNEKATKLPVKCILFSPWIDISMSNQDLKKQESKDKILPFAELIKAAKKYAGATDLNHYLLSPIYGNFEDLPATMLFYGTHELFYPDFIKLKDKIKSHDNFIFQEFPEMQHDWILFPIPESKKALKLAIDFIKE
jgi:acetyl esterase/lipase